MRKLASAGPTACLPAITFASQRCTLAPTPVPPGGLVSAVVHVAATLELNFLNCGDARVTAAGVDYVLLNPGGQNLGTEQAPLPLTFILFAALWLALGITGAVNVWRREAACTLQVCLLSVPFIKVAHMAVAAAKWAALSVSGVERGPLNVAVVVVLTTSQVNLLGVLLLLSRGWLVTRAALGAPERNSLLLSLALLASLYFVYHLWSPRSFFALAIAYVCVLGFAFTSVSHGLRHLRAQAQLLRVSGEADAGAAAWVRVQIFAGFHGALFVFTCIEVVLHLVALFIPGAVWLNALFSEVADFGLALVIGVLFRPRRVSPFVRDDTEEMLRAAASNIIAGRGRLLHASPTDEELSRIMAQLQSRHNSDASGSHASLQQAAALPVLIENPCSFDSHGRAVVSVSVGVPHAMVPKPPEEGGPAAVDAAQAGASGDATRLAPQAYGEQERPYGGTAAQPLAPPRPPHLELGVTQNPLLERRLTQTQPDERDTGAAALTAADRFRSMWGAPGFLPRPASDGR